MTKLLAVLKRKLFSSEMLGVDEKYWLFTVGVKPIDVRLEISKLMYLYSSADSEISYASHKIVSSLLIVSHVVMSACCSAISCHLGSSHFVQSGHL